MNLTDTLKLVSGAVSTKDLLPVLTHFCIYDARIQGANGRVAIDAPCAELSDLRAVVPADRFLQAVTACSGDPKLTLSDERTRLTVSRGRFRARMSLLPHDSFAREELQEGASVSLQQPLLPTLRLLAPFVSTDASRPWACSVLLRDGYMYATNNVVVARAPYAFAYDSDCVLPAAGVDELLRIEQEPRELCITPHACFALYAEGSWLKMQLLQAQWPDVLARLVQLITDDELPELPETLLADVMLLKPFFPDARLPVVRMGADGVSTLDGEHSAQVDGIVLPAAAFRLESLSLVLALATRADFSRSPALWRGGGVEGLLSGVRI